MCRSQESSRTTGIFHIKGVLIDDSPYYNNVAVVNQGNTISSNPLIDTFLLPQQLGAKESGTAAASNESGTPHNMNNLSIRSCMRQIARGKLKENVAPHSSCPLLLWAHILPP